jgi:hypothetical protein
VGDRECTRVLPKNYIDERVVFISYQQSGFPCHSCALCTACFIVVNCAFSACTICRGVEDTGTVVCDDMVNVPCSQSVSKDVVMLKICVSSRVGLTSYSVRHHCRPRLKRALWCLPCRVCDSRKRVRRFPFCH